MYRSSAHSMAPNIWILTYLSVRIEHTHPVAIHYEASDFTKVLFLPFEIQQTRKDEFTNYGISSERDQAKSGA